MRCSGAGREHERDSEGRGLALLLVVAQLIPVLSRRVDVARAPQPARQRERRSAGHCTSTAAVPGARRALRHGRLWPCQGHTATMAQLECGHPRGSPNRGAGCPDAVPVSRQGLRVVVLLPARTQRLNGARGQLPPAHGNLPRSFPLASTPRPSHQSNLCLLRFQSRLTSSITKTMKRKTTTAVRPMSHGCSTLGPVSAWPGDREGKTWGWGQLQGSSIIQGMGPPPTRWDPPWDGTCADTHCSPFPLSLGYQGSHPRHPSPVPSTMRSTGAPGRCLQVLLLYPEKVTVGTLGQTGPTGKISQELI